MQGGFNVAPGWSVFHSFDFKKLTGSFTNSILGLIEKTVKS
jgi:hypothetical protein